MKFVPLGSTGLKVSVWETRVRDFEEFATRTGHPAPWGLYTIENGKWGNTQRSWRDPGFAQTPEHPVCGIDWFTAQTFCRWLTERERAAGVITSAVRYRLPTTAEWNLACGLPAQPADPLLPLAGRYPWGSDFPPHANAGNYAGAEVLDGPWPADRPPLPGYRDDFRFTSPAGSFAANALGIFDLGGNLWEWCEDGPPGLPDQRWLRGASWINSKQETLDAAFRWYDPRRLRMAAYGFRVVLAPE